MTDDSSNPPASNSGVTSPEPEGTACQQAATYGIDLSLLSDNLRFTPAQRMQRHDRCLTTALELRQAMTHSAHDAPCSSPRAPGSEPAPHA